MSKNNGDETADYVRQASAGIARRLTELEPAYSEYCRLMSAQRALRQLRAEDPRPPGRLGRSVDANSLASRVREALVNGEATAQEICDRLTRRGFGYELATVTNTVGSLRNVGDVESVERGVYALTDAGAAKLEQAGQA